MTTTEISPVPADSAGACAPDVRRAQAALDKARETTAAATARLVCDLSLICGSTAEVDAIAAEWDVPAGWTADLAQYRTLPCTWPASIAAVYTPPVAGKRVAA